MYCYCHAVRAPVEAHATHTVTLTTEQPRMQKVDWIQNNKHPKFAGQLSGRPSFMPRTTHAERPKRARCPCVLDAQLQPGRCAGARQERTGRTRAYA